MFISIKPLCWPCRSQLQVKHLYRCFLVSCYLVLNIRDANNPCPDNCEAIIRELKLISPLITSTWFWLCKMIKALHSSEWQAWKVYELNSLWIPESCVVNSSGYLTVLGCVKSFRYSKRTQYLGSFGALLDLQIRYINPLSLNAHTLKPRIF